jgi:hypothetical protein
VRLDTSGRAWLQTEGNNGAISSALHLHVRECAAADCFRAGNVCRRKLYVKAITAAVRFVVIERLIATDRNA